jgi:hypothetical protein
LVVPPPGMLSAEGKTRKQVQNTNRSRCLAWKKGAAGKAKKAEATREKRKREAEAAAAGPAVGRVRRLATAGAAMLGIGRGGAGD